MKNFILPVLAFSILLFVGCSKDLSVSAPKDDSLDLPVSQRDDFNAVKTRAAQGSVEAQLYTGILYYTGSVGRNQGEALKWFLRAAAQGSSEAQYFLSEMYEKGIHVEQNQAKSLQYLVSSARAGYLGARLKLARNWLSGQIQNDMPLSEIRGWLAEAASNGHEDAKILLEKANKK